eukprot:5982786-Pleurochrysis_carterae.AAC.2
MKRRRASIADCSRKRSKSSSCGVRRGGRSCSNRSIAKKGMRGRCGPRRYAVRVCGLVERRERAGRACAFEVLELHHPCMRRRSVLRRSVAAFFFESKLFSPTASERGQCEPCTQQARACSSSLSSHVVKSAGSVHCSRRGQLLVRPTLRTERLRRTCACARLCAYAYTRACVLACVRACVRARARACVRACVRARARARPRLCASHARLQCEGAVARTGF